MASSDSVELYQPCSRGGGTAPFGFKTRRDIFRIARPFPRPKCPHRSPVYSAVYTRAFPHSSESYKRYRPRRERFLETVYDCRDDVRFSFNGSGQRPTTRTTPKELHQTRLLHPLWYRSKLLHVSAKPIPSNKATRATNAVFRDVSTAYVLRDRKQSFIARFPLFRSV